jgi:apolipoprotein N-acyltransferase
MKKENIIFIGIELSIFVWMLISIYFKLQNMYWLSGFITIIIVYLLLRRKDMVKLFKKS